MTADPARGHYNLGRTPARARPAALSVGIVAMVGILGAGAYVGATAHCGVLLSLREPGDTLGEPSFAILNPFRDKGPEVAATRWLAALGKGEWSASLDEVTSLGQESKAYLREREKQRPLLEWRLSNWRRSKTGVVLFFRARREGDSDALRSPLWLTLSEVPTGQWVVTKFEAWY